MRATPSITFDENTVTSSTVAEPHASEQEYDPAKIYVAGDKVVSVAAHRTYESLAGASAEVTIAIASPGVVTWINHDLAEGTPIAFTTTGALPAGLTPGTIYYVIAPTSNTFRLSETKGGAAIATTGSQSGAHTAVAHPNVNRALDDRQWWADIGPTMKWAMFDLYRSTGTTDTGPLTIVITPGERVNAIILVGLDADAIEITVEAGDPLEEVYSYSESLTTRSVAGWYDFFFAPFEFQRAVQLFDIPPFVSSVITITLTREGGEVSCGGVIMGRAVYMGEAQIGAVSDTLNFSTIERNTFGEAALIPRRNVPTADLTIRCGKSRVNVIRKLRDDLNAVPAFWSGIDDPTHGYFEAVSMLGIYKRLAINLDYPNHAEISLQIEEI